MDFASHLKRAELLLDHGRYELAEQEARGALALAPDNADAHAILARCLERRNQFDEAEQAARQAIHLAPDESRGYFTLSCVLMRRPPYEEALQAIQEAIRLAPHWANYRYIQAFLFREVGNYRAALEAADAGLALDANHVECMNVRAEALMDLNRPREARSMIRAALRLEPENETTRALLGDHALSANDSKQALDHYREALRINPECSATRSEFEKTRTSLYGRLVRLHLDMARRRGAFELAFFLIPMSLYCLIRLYYWLVPLKLTPPPWVVRVPPWIVLMVSAYIMLVAWYGLFSRPMMDLLFRFDRRCRLIGGVALFPFGEQKFIWPPARHARAFLAPERLASSNVFGVCLLLAFSGFWGAVGTISNGDRGVGFISQMFMLPPYLAFILTSAGFRPKLLSALLGVLAGLVLLEQIAWQTDHLAAQRWCEGMFHLWILASIWCVRFSPRASPNEGEASTAGELEIAD
jgi:tetratricopeptide (TPR) repeat protein